jgi:hypothetical protein
MTFTNPFSTLVQNQRVTSAMLNIAGEDITFALDKRGDNLGNGGGISGQIDVLTDGYINIYGNLQVQEDGYIQLNNGSWQYVTSGAFILWQNGSWAQINDGAQLILQSGSTVSGNITFADGVPVTISQVTTPNAPNLFSIVSQSTTNTGYDGANIQIIAGSGGNGKNGGNVIIGSEGTFGGFPGFVQFQFAGNNYMTIQTVGTQMYPTTNGQAFYQLPFQGTENSQLQSIQTVPYVLRTTTTAPTNIAGFGIPNNTCAMFMVSYVLRGLVGSGVFGNQAIVMAVCDNVGTVNTSVAPVITANLTDFDYTGACITATNPAANTCTIVANSPYSATIDWTIEIHEILS